MLGYVELPHEEKWAAPGVINKEPAKALLASLSDDAQIAAAFDALKAHWDGLRIDPCIPHGWDGYTVTRRFRGADYRITVENTSHVCRGVKRLTVDGKTLEGNILPAFSDGKEHAVTAVLGE